MSLCKKCGLDDRYYRGTFSSCRPCHNAAQKRYAARKALGEIVEVKPAPKVQLALTTLSTAAKRVTCKNGHLLTDENIQVTSQRRGKHLFRRCRVCDKNLKRVKYGLPVEQPATTLSGLLD